MGISPIIEAWLNERYVEEGKGHVAHTDGYHEEIDPLLPEILMKENDGNQDGVKDKSEEEADEDGYVHISDWVRLHKIFPREAALSVICRKQGITQYSPCFVGHIFCHLHGCLLPNGHLCRPRPIVTFDILPFFAISRSPLL